jgi:hypothetical protein
MQLPQYYSALGRSGEVFLFSTICYNSSRRKPHAQYEHRAAQHPLLAATSGSPKRLVTAAILNNHLFDYSS